MPALTTERRPAAPVPPVPGGGSEHAPRGAPAPAGQGWSVRHRRQLAVSDALVVLWAVAGAHVIRFQGDRAALDIGTFTSSYLALSVVLAVAWWVALALTASRDARIVGVGAEEFRRVLGTSLRLFGSIAVVAFVVQADLARGYLAVAFPLGTLGLLLTRWMWRRLLHRQREEGLSGETVVVVGTAEQAEHLVQALRRRPHAGLRVVGACLSGDEPTGRLPSGVPVVGGLHDTAAAAARAGATTVAVTASDAVGPAVLRRIGWELEARGLDLVVAPSLTDVAGFRVHTRPVAGLPLLHVEAPRYEGANRAAKRAFDVVGAASALLVLAPVLALVAVAVRLDGPGPVLFRQERVGISRRTFTMLKFRTMVVDAELRLSELSADNDSDGPLFKLRQDPRVTRVGRVLRRYSLDELPQFLNVLRGDMSLVGPRPPLRAEVDAYADDVHRRLLVRPGITGLWQVSGRSDLSWEESVRLDLYYVENWSLLDDVLILARTVRAVVAPSGAY